MPTAGGSGGSRPSYDAIDDNKHESMPPAFMRAGAGSMAVDGDREPADSEHIGGVDSPEERVDVALEAAAEENDAMDANLAQNPTVEEQRDLLDEALDQAAEEERLVHARATFGRNRAASTSGPTARRTRQAQEKCGSHC